MKALIVGEPGSGKSTFAGEMAQRLEIPHVPIDEFAWGPEWREVSDKLL